MFEKLNMKLLLPTAITGVVFLVIAVLMGDSLQGLTAVILMFVMLAIQLGLSYVYSNVALTNRLANLKEYLGLVSSTNKAPDRPLADEQSDDLAEITNELSGFIANLSEVLAEIREESESLNAGSSSLAAQMVESVSAVDEASNQIESMAGALSQVTETSNLLSESA
ncbi:MAG: hypothetical protein MK214_06045 [Thalassotalea sp.]|nr:hypothetical protein [Thalassotalea sp.]